MRRTIVTAPGSADLVPADGGTYGTVRLGGDSGARSLTIRNSGGTSTIALGVEVGDGTVRLVDTGIEVSGGSDANLAIAPAHLSTGALLEFDDGLVEVAQGTGIGTLGPESYDTLRVHDSRVAVTGGGVGIGATTTGAQSLTDVDITVQGGTSTVGLAGTGSGFQPLLRNSSITVSGGSTSNTGVDAGQFFVVTLQGTRITASGVGAIAMELGLGPTDSGQVVVDSSVLSATTVFSSINAGTSLRVGGSKLAGTTIVSGAGTFVCVASYKSNYTALSATCT
jgi:hypothetical protein